MAFLLSDTASVGLDLTSTTDPQTVLKVDELLGNPDRFRFFDWGVNFQVESLLLSIDLQSLSTSEVPNIYIEDSEAIALKKRIQLEQDAEKIGIEFLLKNSGDRDYRRISRKNLLNHHGYNYLEECLPQIGGYDGVKRLGKGSELAVKLVDLGSGLLAVGDSLTIEATCVWSIEGFRKPDIMGSPVSFGIEVGATPTLIRSSNADRARLVLQNVGDKPAWLHFGNRSGCVPYQCLRIDPAGVAYEIADNPSLLITQTAWGVSESATRLVGMEVSFAF